MPEQKPKSKAGYALVVDDHAVTRFGLAQFLVEKLHFTKCYEAGNFQHALNELDAHAVDLAIFDLGIPGLVSPIKLANVRQRWPRTRVVVLSGSDLRRNILDALEAGVHGYIVKTDSMSDLAERLNYVIAGGIYVPPCLAERTVEKSPAEDGANGSRKPVNAVKLTERQLQVLRGIVQGQSNKQIAKDLNLSIGTVKMHVSAVLTALGAQNRSHAAALGRQLID